MQGIAVLFLLLGSQLAQANPVTIPYSASSPTSSASGSPASLVTVSPSSLPTTLTPPSASIPVISPTPSIPSTGSTTSSGSPPEVTAAPEVDGDLEGFADTDSLNMKFKQTTYWSCVAWTYTTHCGWHEPILDAGAARVGCGGARMVVRAGVVAGVVGGLVLGT